MLMSLSIQSLSFIGEHFDILHVLIKIQ